jgi:peptidoglycan/LPS O-acetylase OafA/YrhL
MGREASGTPRRPEILCLTSLRSMAAIEVVLMHTLFELGGQSAETLPTVVVELLTRGATAVTFFFVLSGFILAYTYADDSGMKGTPRKFWRARFARIYPLYLLGFLIDVPRVAALFLTTTPSLKVAVGKLSVAGVAYLALIQSWHPRVSNTFNTPGWSLSTEAFFYAVFPALLMLTRSWSFRRILGIVVATWALPILAYELFTHLRLVDLESNGFQTFWRSFPPLHLPEFALGVATGRLFVAGQVRGKEHLVRWSGVAAFVFILLLSGYPELVPGALQTSLLAPPFAVAILAVGSGALPTFGWLDGAALVLLGRASYAVYILHQPLKTVFLMVVRCLGLDAPSPSLLIAYLIFVELCGVALFLYFEDPLRRYFRDRSRYPEGGSARF